MSVAERLAYPTQPEELSADWLTERLRAAGGLAHGARVSGFSTTPVGEGVGLLGRLVRIALRYEGAANDAPRTLIGKFSAAPGDNRAVAMHFRLYEREVRFYQHVAPSVGGSAPRCYAAEVDAEGGAAVLLLEDLGDYRMGDQIEGCTAEEAEMVLDALAPMHARFWGRTDDPTIAWAPRIDGAIQVEGISGGCAAGWGPCADRFGHVIAPEILARREQFVAAVPVLHDWMARPVQTLVHGDIRLDNLMFGAQPDHRPLVGLDWIVTYSAGVHDLAYLLSQNMKIPERRAHEARLIARYQRQLAELGVPDYSLEQAWADYKVCVLYMFSYAVVIAGTLDPANERGARMMEQLVRRASTTLMDHELLSMLPN